MTKSSELADQGGRGQHMADKVYCTGCLVWLIDIDIFANWVFWIYLVIVLKLCQYLVILLDCKKHDKVTNVVVH